MVNNLDYIKFRLKEVFDLNNKDLFFHVLILQRKKEVEGINKNSNVIKSYAVRNLEYLENKLNSEIISICDSQKARAMINLNPKSFKRVSHSMLRRLSEYIESDFYEGAITKLFDICTTSSSINKELGIEKYWLVDVDIKDQETFSKTQSIINLCSPIEVGKQKIRGFEETKNGFHLFTTPFNLKEFNDYKQMVENMKIFMNVEVKKDCLTNLYIP